MCIGHRSTDRDCGRWQPSARPSPPPLASAGVRAETEQIPATLDEVFVEISGSAA